METKPTTAQRDALLKAGEFLVCQPAGASAMTAASVCQQAGLEEAVFIAAFKDIEQFKGDLLTHLMDSVRADALPMLSLGTTTPGRDRIWRTMEAFLDANLRRPAMRSLAHDLRTDARALELLRRRTTGYSAVFKLELDTTGKPDSAAAARLFTTMTVDTARAEHEAGHALADMRRALFAMLRGYVS